MSDSLPDNRAQFVVGSGTYYVDLWRGILFDRVTIWKDVAPALGGVMGTRRVRRSRGVALWNEAVTLAEGALRRGPAMTAIRYDG